MLEWQEYWQKMISKESHVYPKEYWDKAALINPYDAILTGNNEEAFWNEEVKMDGLNKNTILLDVGCGIGRIAKWVSPLIKEYHGVDFSSEMINKAKEIFKDDKNVFFLENNGIDLKLFEDNKFDVVHICLVFQHMQRELTLNYIKEIYRVLKKGGIFFANNIPKIERYSNGLTEKEVSEAIKPFETLDLEESEFYYNIKLKKEEK